MPERRWRCATTSAIDQGYFIGQLDNVLSAAILVYLFEIGFRGTAFFTAQEEAGRSWRYLLEWFRRFGGSTNHLIVLDTSPYPTRADADRSSMWCFATATPMRPSTRA